MARQKKEQTAPKVAKLSDKKSELDKLREENNRMKTQISYLMRENNYLRKITNQPDNGPLLPPFIQRDTLEKLDDQDWYYRALDDKGIPMILEKNTGKWIRLSRANYERYNGPIPKNYVVSPIDGNNRNFDPYNWIALPKNEMMEKSGFGYEGTDGTQPASYEKYDLETGEVIDDE